MNKDEITEIAIKLGAKCKVDSWLELKKIILISIPSKSRSLFSTRDPITKLQGLNTFEQSIIGEYEKRTGTKLEVL
jgi:hypothetical protein